MSRLAKTPPPRRRRPTLRRAASGGFFAIEVIAGLLLLAAIAGVIAVAVTGRARSAATLGASRAAARSAERAIVDLRLGRDAGEGVTVRPLDAEPPAPGLRWVEVTTTGGGRSATLVGVVRDGGASASTRPATRPAEGGGR